MLKKVTIYGERCSGTNYLEQLLIHNFEVEIVWSYGWKHFFGFHDLINTNTDDVLFIGIVRNLTDWINSLYREKHHLPVSITQSHDAFLNNEIYSVNADGSEMMNDRNIFTKERYKNIFELRHVKNQFLVENMPLLVKNYLLITHDSLMNDFVNVMNRIRNCNLQVKSKIVNNIEFPCNVMYYKSEKKKRFIKKNNQIPKEVIISKVADLHYEIMLFTEDYK